MKRFFTPRKQAADLSNLPMEAQRTPQPVTLTFIHYNKDETLNEFQSPVFTEAMTFIGTPA